MILARQHYVSRLLYYLKSGPMKDLPFSQQLSLSPALSILGSLGVILYTAKHLRGKTLELKNDCSQENVCGNSFF